MLSSVPRILNHMAGRESMALTYRFALHQFRRDESPIECSTEAPLAAVGAQPIRFTQGTLLHRRVPHSALLGRVLRGVGSRNRVPTFPIASVSRNENRSRISLHPRYGVPPSRP